MEAYGIGREEGQVAAAEGFRFPKGERLRRSEDIQCVLRNGRRYSSGGIQLLVLKMQEESSAARAGFIVKRKIGGAVRRNQMKRRMREAYRRLKNRVAGGADLVISATETMDFHEVSSRIENLLDKAGVLKG